MTSKNKIMDIEKTQAIIKKKIKDRKVFLKLYDDSFDVKTSKHTINEPKEIDLIGKEIRDLVVAGVSELPADFIIESLTMLGDAPNVLYDDNGMFAISGDGYQPVVYGNKRIEGIITVSVEKNMWKKTIREAIKFYLK